MANIIKYEVSDSDIFGFGKYLWQTDITLGENQHFLFRDTYKINVWTGDIEEQVGMKLVKVVDDEWLDKHDWMYYNIRIENNTDKEFRRRYKEEFGDYDTDDDYSELDEEPKETTKKS